MGNGAFEAKQLAEAGMQVDGVHCNEGKDNRSNNADSKNKPRAGIRQDCTADQTAYC